MKFKNIQIIILLSLAGVFFLINRPRIVAVRKLKNTLKEMEYKIKNAYNIDLENKNYMKNEKPKIEKEIAKLDKKMPPEEEEIAILKQLTSIARSSGINKVYFKKLKKEQSRGRKIIQKRFRSRRGSGTSDVEILPMEMEIHSSYRRLAQLLKKINQLSRLVTVENVLIQMEEKILPKLKITININSYYLPVKTQIDADK